MQAVQEKEQVGKKASSQTRKAGTEVPKSTSKRRSTTPRPKNMHNKELGTRGEDIAADFLRRRGFSILERNWKCFVGEADIIALDDEALHFVEVKTRIGEGSGFPAEAVDAKKRRRYEAISEIYLSSYCGCETAVTFDIIAINVLKNERAYVRFYKNVLSCDCR